MESGPSKHEIIAKLRILLPELRDRYKIASIGLFGSIVREEAGPNSDVDILVKFLETRSIFEILDAEEFLSDQLGRTVDLVTEKSLKPHVGKVVLAEVEMV